MENGRCRVHGGASLKGPASPTYKHGRYSEVLPKKLLAGYARQMADADLLLLRDEIAAVDSLVLVEMEKMGGPESRAIWRRLKHEFNAFKKAQRRKNWPQAAVHMDEVDRLISQGAREYQQQDRILELFERRRRLVDSESRREQVEKHMLSYADAATTFDRLVDAVAEVVDDRDTMRRVSEEFSRIVGRPVLDHEPEASW